jgi:hypothetical protein
MTTHKVGFTIPERPLGNVDVEFTVKRDGQILGRLKLSKGNMVWVPKNAQYGLRLSWSDFDNLMREQGKSEKT